MKYEVHIVFAAEREEYRLRVGDYRILYTIDDSSHIAKVIKIGHRGEIYR